MSDGVDHQQPDSPNSPERPEPKLTEDWFTRPDPVLQQLAHWSHQIGMTVTLYLAWGSASGNITGCQRRPKLTPYCWASSSTRGSVFTQRRQPCSAQTAGVSARGSLDRFRQVYDGSKDTYNRSLSTIYDGTFVQPPLL
jgi:hypothetical protein